MPAPLMGYQTTIGDHTHNGPNQAGNKSLLSYRSDIGVPGYTGFIAGPQSVVLPVKAFEHTGKPVSQSVKDAATTATMGPKAKMSEYTDRYLKQPNDTQLTDRTGGGYWIAQRNLGASAPFVATTTYRAEVLNAPETAGKQLERSLGLPCTLPQYEAARQTAPRAQSADPSMRHVTDTARLRATNPLYASTSPTRIRTVRPATSITTAGELVGYQTTNHATYVQNPRTGGDAAPAVAAAAAMAGPKPKYVDPDGRYAVMPRAMAPTMYGSASAYTKDFGEDCSDPMERGAPAERFQSRIATTRDLAAGTTRVSNNPPGYTGHIAASKYNALAQAQSHAPDERMSRQNNMLLYELDQFGRSRIPGYTGYKPQAARNITLEQPSQGPATCTTQGAANLQATRNGLPAKDTTHHHNAKKGIYTFFTSGGEFVSDNGLANAAHYYKQAPSDAKFKMSHLPHSTVYGKPFDPRNSLV